MIKGHRFQKHLSWSFYKTQNFSVPFLIAPDQNRKLILQLAVSLSLKNLKKKWGQEFLWKREETEAFKSLILEMKLTFASLDSIFVN